MNRRAIITTAPLAGFAAAVAVIPAAAETETPISAMHREIIRLRDYSYDPAFREPDADAANDRMYDLANNELPFLPATSLRDWALKLLAYTIDGEFSLDDCPALEQLWAEARALTGIGGEA